MQKQQHLFKDPNHGAILNNMRLNDNWCDVTIKVNETEIRAHKLVLVANLKYFEKMFTSDDFGESKDGVITMDSVQEADLEAFVSYAYTGEILLTDSNALSYLKVADHLVVDSIKEACIEFLKEHLRIEEACRAYKFADAVNLPELKNVARATIITNFGDCSKNADYLDFDYESLADILSNGKAQPSETQHMLFEGIMRWIVYDAENRKIHIKNLLSCINMIKLTADDLIDCMYERVADRNDQHDIMKVTMLYHLTTKIEQKFTQQLIKQQEEHGQLLIMGRTTTKSFHMQFYDLNEKKWSSVQETPETDVVGDCYSAVLNDKLYYTRFTCAERHLQVFDHTTRRITKVHSSNSIPWIAAAMCACNRFVYLCGGRRDGYSASDQVLRYDPEENSLETLTPLGAKRYSASAIFYQGCLHVLGGYNGSSALNSVERYNPETKEWTAFPSMCEDRLNPALAILDEKLYACGGSDGKSVEVYDPAINSWLPVSPMNKLRMCFLVVAYKGKLLAIGGAGERSVEVYDPSKNQWQIDLKMSLGLQIEYHIGALISSSSITDAN